MMERSWGLEGMGEEGSTMPDLFVCELQGASAGVYLTAGLNRAVSFISALMM